MKTKMLSTREERRDALLFALSILSMLLSIMVPFGLLPFMLTSLASVDWDVVLALSQGVVAMNPWFLIVPFSGIALFVIWKILQPTPHNHGRRQN